jgi:hypothetical protein
MIDRALVLLGAGCVIFGAVIVTELIAAEPGTSAGAAAARRPEPPAPPRAQGPRVEELLTTILGRPLFSPTRKPASPDSPDQPASQGLTDVRLTGIVIEPQHRLAIFAVPGAKPLVRSEGGTVNDWRVDSITLEAVTLSGAGGNTTLQPKTDTTLARRAPPRPTPATPVPVPAMPPPAPAAARPGTPPRPGATLPGAAPPRPATMPVAPPGAPKIPPGMPNPARGRE